MARSKSRASGRRTASRMTNVRHSAKKRLSPFGSAMWKIMFVVLSAAFRGAELLGKPAPASLIAAKAEFEAKPTANRRKVPTKVLRDVQCIMLFEVFDALEDDFTTSMFNRLCRNKFFDYRRMPIGLAPCASGKSLVILLLAFCQPFIRRVVDVYQPIDKNTSNKVSSASVIFSYERIPRENVAKHLLFAQDGTPLDEKAELFKEVLGLTAKETTALRERVAMNFDTNKEMPDSETLVYITTVDRIAETWKMPPDTISALNKRHLENQDKFKRIQHLGSHFSMAFVDECDRGTGPLMDDPDVNKVKVAAMGRQIPMLGFTATTTYQDMVLFRISCGNKYANRILWPDPNAITTKFLSEGEDTDSVVHKWLEHGANVENVAETIFNFITKVYFKRIRDKTTHPGGVQIVLSRQSNMGEFCDALNQRFKNEDIRCPITGVLIQVGYINSAKPSETSEMINKYNNGELTVLLACDSGMRGFSVDCTALGIAFYNFGDNDNGYNNFSQFIGRIMRYAKITDHFYMNRLSALKKRMREAGASRKAIKKAYDAAVKHIEESLAVQKATFYVRPEQFVMTYRYAKENNLTELEQRMEAMVNENGSEKIKAAMSEVDPINWSGVISDIRLKGRKEVAEIDENIAVSSDVSSDVEESTDDDEDDSENDVEETREDNDKQSSEDSEDSEDSEGDDNDSLMNAIIDPEYKPKEPIMWSEPMQPRQSLPRCAKRPPLVEPPPSGGFRRSILHQNIDNLVKELDDDVEMSDAAVANQPVSEDTDSKNTNNEATDTDSMNTNNEATDTDSKNTNSEATDTDHKSSGSNAACDTVHASDSDDEATDTDDDSSDNVPSVPIVRNIRRDAIGERLRKIREIEHRMTNAVRSLKTKMWRCTGDQCNTRLYDRELLVKAEKDYDLDRKMLEAATLDTLGKVLASEGAQYAASSQTKMCRKCTRRENESVVVTVTKVKDTIQHEVLFVNYDAKNKHKEAVRRIVQEYEDFDMEKYEDYFEVVRNLGMPFGKMDVLYDLPRGEEMVRMYAAVCFFVGVNFPAHQVRTFFKVATKLFTRTTEAKDVDRETQSFLTDYCVSSEDPGHYYVRSTIYSKRHYYNRIIKRVKNQKTKVVYDRAVTSAPENHDALMALLASTHKYIADSDRFSDELILLSSMMYSFCTMMKSCKRKVANKTLRDDCLYIPTMYLTAKEKIKRKTNYWKTLYKYGEVRTEENKNRTARGGYNNYSWTMEEILKTKGMVRKDKHAIWLRGGQGEEILTPHDHTVEYVDMIAPSIKVAFRDEIQLFYDDEASRARVPGDSRKRARSVEAFDGRKRQRK